MIHVGMLNATNSCDVDQSKSLHHDVDQQQSSQLLQSLLLF